MSYLTFRGVSTQSLPGVYVQEMPSHKKAGKRMTKYHVNGRDGELHRDEGFENFDVRVRLVFINASAETRQLVNAWADGTGKLISSDNLALAYNATVEEELQYDRVVASTVAPAAFDTTKAYYVGDYVTYSGTVYKFTANHAAGAWNSAQVQAQPWLINGLYDTVDIIFNCEPCMVEAVDSQIVFTQNGSLVNPGTAEAFPLIKIEGSGDTAVEIAGEYLVIESMSADDPVYIDCSSGYIYTSDGTATQIHGDIPVLPLGTSYVYFGAGCSKVTITPHWRWV